MSIEHLLEAGNQASARVRGLWITFILFGTYLAIAIGGTTHEQLLLESPVGLPFLDIGLPLVNFYRVAPILFLILHFYLLIQLYLLAHTLRDLNEAIDNEISTHQERNQVRTRADKFLVTQLLIGRHRDWLLRRFIVLAAWLTMVAAPILILLAFQIRFLPYHDVEITWLHRIVLYVDLILIWLLWPVISHPSGRLGGTVTALAVRMVNLLKALLHKTSARRATRKDRSFPDQERVSATSHASIAKTFRAIIANFGRVAVLLGFTSVIVGFSLLVATIPGEATETWILRRSWLVGPSDDTPTQSSALESGNTLAPTSGKLELDPQTGTLSNLSLGLELDRWLSKVPRVPPVLGEPASMWWPTAMLFEGPANTVTSTAESLFSRNLILIDADLVRLGEAALGDTDRTLNFRGRDLRYAQFDLADMRKADLTGAKAAGASFKATKLVAARLDGAELQGTVFNKAQLDGASLERAQLQGALLEEAQLQGASLVLTQLQGATLVQAHLQGASLEQAQLQGATLDQAQLQGASIEQTQLQGASLEEAQLQGASLELAKLHGASLKGVQLQGASLQQASLRGASLVGAELQGALLFGADLRGASLDETRLDAAWVGWARLKGASFAQANLLMAEKLIEKLELAFVAGATATDPYADTDPDERTRKAQADVNAWLAAIPEGQMREEARVRLSALLDSHKYTTNEYQTYWKKFIEKRADSWTTRSESDLAKYLGKLGCSKQEAPHLARGLLERISSEARSNPRIYHKPLAVALLKPDCLGAKVLTEDEIARLEEIAAGN